MHPGASVGTTTRRIAVAALLFSAATARGAEPASAGPVAREALAICKRADRVPPDERAALLTFGLERAEDAVRTDPQDAAAHLAVFCNLGKGLQSRSGWGLLAAFSDLSRARKELDTALGLLP